MQHRFVSSKRPTMYASHASWSARRADVWNRRSLLKYREISRTSLWNGSFLIRSSVDFWYFLISRRATVPGRYRCCLLIPMCEVWLLRADSTLSFTRGALPPVDFRAVCFVRAIECARQKVQTHAPQTYLYPGKMKFHSEIK